nr:kinesin light chain [Quercus suber]
MTAPPPPPQAPAKRQFWRVQNINASERDIATAWLQREVQELAISDGLGFSIAADGERTLCATLTSLNPPTPEHARWRVDHDFIGFTPLCDPVDATVDIVIVTGLGGHALGSFRSADGTSVWLRDFAPKDVPRARFITYGYDTAVAASNSNQGVRELAHTLLDGLANFRRQTQTQTRPLCFVCHSLGGVVLKEALVMSSKATAAKHAELYQVMVATYGLVLIGVPNLGLRHDQLQSVVQGRANQGFVRDLLVQSDGEASQFLSYLTAEFSRLDRQRRPPFEIISYYETMSSPTVVDVGDGHFAMNGRREFMVSKTSAERIGHVARDVDHLPSNTDHRGLVRFEHAQDHRYRSMIAKLARMAGEAAAHEVGDANVLLRQLGQMQALPPETNIVAGQLALPSKYLPFLRNQHFVGRSTELEALEQKLFVKQDCHRMAVVGLGGIGKTQVVLRFAHAVLEKHGDVSVFWVPALSAELFGQAYREIARVVGVHVPTDGSEDVKKLVQRHLSDVMGGRWLMVVDNADDAELLDGVNGEGGLLEHLPTSDTGLIVFTTRDGEVAQALAGSDVVTLEKMSDVEGLEILNQALNVKAFVWDEVAAIELLVELDYLPLAITQAAAYINSNRTSLEEYLSLIRSTEEDIVYILSQEMQDNKRYKQSKQKHAIAATWLVSFKRIIKRDTDAGRETDAADLLQYMCCIEWKAIPHSILPPLQPTARMASAIGTLCAYSFVTRREGEKTYDMHRLVHLAARVWLGQSGSLAERQRMAMQHLTDIFPSDDYDNRDVWREYIPHAARMKRQENKNEGEDAAVRGRLCLKVGWCLRVDGRIGGAVRWLEESCDCKIDLAQDHPSRLASQHALAAAYRADGQIKQAVWLLEQVKQAVGLLGAEHPSTLTSMANLASTYKKQGRWKEAEELQVKEMETPRTVLRAEHPDTLASMNNLALTYPDQERWTEAEALQSQAASGYQRSRGLEHPNTLAALETLAYVECMRQQEQSENIVQETPHSYQPVPEQHGISKHEVYQHPLDTKKEVLEQSKSKFRLP